MAYKEISPIIVSEGGTGKTSLTAYAVVCGGTTSTGAMQSIASVGTTGQLLTSNGAGALPTYQTQSYTANDATTATPSSSNLNVFGSPTTILSTTASGSTVTTRMVNGANGQLIIGGGASPLWANLSSSDASIVITNGANSIDLKSGVSAIAINVQTFTSSGTYTPTAGMKYCTIEVVGGGGGSGGCASTGVAEFNVTGGGGGGGYSRKTVTNLVIGPTKTVTVGAAGTAGTAGNNPGGAGGTSSVGAILSATGGNGSSGSATSAAPTVAQGGAGGVGSGGDLNTPGSNGGLGWTSNSAALTRVTGAGGDSIYGAGAASVGFAASAAGASSGNTGIIYGGGASGSTNGNGQPNLAGSAGAAGVVIITEYI